MINRGLDSRIILQLSTEISTCVQLCDNYSFICVELSFYETKANLQFIKQNYRRYLPR